MIRNLLSKVLAALTLTALGVAFFFRGLASRYKRKAEQATERVEHAEAALNARIRAEQALQAERERHEVERREPDVERRTDLEGHW